VCACIQYSWSIHNIWYKYVGSLKWLWEKVLYLRHWWEKVLHLRPCISNKKRELSWKLELFVSYVWLYVSFVNTCFLVRWIVIWIMSSMRQVCHLNYVNHENDQYVLNILLLKCWIYCYFCVEYILHEYCGKEQQNVAEILPKFDENEAKVCGKGVLGEEGQLCHFVMVWES
jgi:hypothetical protein